MLKKSEKRKLEAKEKEWEEVSHGVNKDIENIKKEIKRDIKEMINWLLFYKPEGTVDKILHIVEVVAVYLFVTKFVFGL